MTTTTILIKWLLRKNLKIKSAKKNSALQAALLCVTRADGSSSETVFSVSFLLFEKLHDVLK